MAIGQLRHDIEGRCCFDRNKAAGKSSMEALRALRRLPDVVHRPWSPMRRSAAPGWKHLRDRHRGLRPRLWRRMQNSLSTSSRPGPGGITGSAGDGSARTRGATTGSSAADSDPDAGSSEKSLPGPVRPSSTRPPRGRRTAPDVTGSRDREVDPRRGSGPTYARTSLSRPRARAPFPWCARCGGAHVGARRLSVLTGPVPSAHPCPAVGQVA